VWSMLKAARKLGESIEDKSIFIKDSTSLERADFRKKWQLETFLKACEQDVDEDWLRPHRAKIDLFLSKMEDFFASQREPDACSSHGSRRSGSVRSAASSTTSSARVKLAQQRAKTYAEKALFEKEERLKEKEMAIRRSQLQQEEERKRIQLQQEEERKRIQLQQEEERKRIQLQQEEE
ncbi:golgin subfamily A member 6-like protein 22, partial [Hyalella azteca]|uniref:Golgin subfamily A member 6-like protein 22 n=1 Tax=Hyalella azteca TaxID=294128 RepID=A0A8B7PCG2_HYAAZ